METAVFRGEVTKVASSLAEAGAEMVEGVATALGKITEDREVVTGDNPMAADALAGGRVHVDAQTALDLAHVGLPAGSASEVTGGAPRRSASRCRSAISSSAIDAALSLSPRERP